MTVAIRFAHLSDWHATSLAGAGVELLRPKRLSGWASWKLSRRHRHSPEILAAAIRDVRELDVDRILVSGDLTHVSLESEFRTAAGQLAALGAPEQVCLIPGNHDCYVPVPAPQGWDIWASYLRGDSDELVSEVLGRDGADPWVEDAIADRAPRHEQYPRVWFEGRLAVIGLCSAIPTPIFRAGGSLGRTQLDRLARLLRRLGERGFARVVMLHHPVVSTDESARRALWDAGELRSVLEQEGAELVLHGHKHRRRVHRIDGPGGPIPIVGVPSSSEVGSRPEKRAQYHVYSFERDETHEDFRLEAWVRGYDAERGAFTLVDEELLA